MTNQITLQPAFVLHQRPYRETSLILDLFTEHHGRISAIARGVRQKRSRTRGILQLFVPLLISWYGKTELHTITSVEGNGFFPFLKGDSLLSGLYLNELLMRALPKHDPHPKLYTFYQHTLVELCNNKMLEKTLRLFEKNLLIELGYALPLSHDISRVPLDETQHYYFHPERGFEIAGSLENAMTVFTGSSLLAIANDHFEDATVLRDAKRLMRLALTPLIGPYPLQSRKLFLEVTKNE